MVRSDVVAAKVRLSARAMGTTSVWSSTGTYICSIFLKYRKKNSLALKYQKTKRRNQAPNFRLISFTRRINKGNLMEFIVNVP